MTMSWTAYVDESEPDPRSGSAGVYLLAAALIEDVEHDAVRAVMERLRIRGQKKLHWNAEEPKRRTVIAETVARLPAMHLVVVRTDAAATAERRRRKCLEILLPELERAKVDRVYLEARERKQNQRDVQLLAALRAQQLIGSGLRLDHVPGPREPLLWIPDVVAGAVGARHGGDSTYEEVLSSLVTYHRA
jgi:hypothetical protein